MWNRLLLSLVLLVTLLPGPSYADFFSSSASSNDIAHEEDTPHVSGDKGALILCIRRTSIGTLSGTNDDYTPIACTAGGEVYVSGVGAETDGAVTPGSTGSLSSKLRLLTTQLDNLQKATATIISQTTATTIGGGVANDTRLVAVHISAALTGTCVIDGFGDHASSAQSFTLPVGSVGFKDFYGAVNAEGALTFTCSNAADDNLVMVLWRPNS